MLNRVTFFSFLVALFMGCANIGTAPKGGPKDEKPPVLDIDESTQNFQTNFKKQDITLVFDEYVDIKDIFKQVIISPPLQKRWQLNKKLKTVTFEFDEDEVLKENATYTVNFGEAVRDFTEGNAVPDLRFVFSTGDFIDSMEVSGSIVDALTGEPAEDVLIMLYDNTADTVVRTERPFYFAKTDKAGNYTIQNVKTDTFKIFALKDEDLNYLFNQETELIGFIDSLFYLSSPKESLPILQVFAEESVLQMNRPNNKIFGLVKLVFNKKPEQVEVNWDSIGQQVFVELEEDSIKVWYDQPDTTYWNLYVNSGIDFLDTFVVKPPDKSAAVDGDSLKREVRRASEIKQLNPTKLIKLSFNHPLVGIDTSKVKVLEDSILNPVSADFKMSGRILEVNHRWRELMTYKVQILPEGLTDIYGLKNQDTIVQDYKVLERKNFSNIMLKVDRLKPEKSYVLKVYYKKTNSLIETIPLSRISVFEKTFESMPLGKYDFEIILDENGNGRWDTGSYDLKTQPERIFKESFEIKTENFDLDVSISVQE